MRDDQAFREALADDVDGLARLHDRELDPELAAALKAAAYPDGLALLPVGEAGQAARANLRQAVAGLPDGAAGGEVASNLDSASAAAWDLLAADYAAIYLTGAAGASPYESVWVTEEHLACQQPMFELRALYLTAGLRVADWRQRYDDHLVLQLQYLAHQLRRGGSWESIALLLDEHLGYWFPDFARRVAQRAQAPFYSALAELTYVWLEQLRDAIADLANLPRPSREVITERLRARHGREAAAMAPLKFMPGAAGPSW